MSEVSPQPQDLNELDSTTNFNQDLTNELAWQLEVDRRINHENAVRVENNAR